MSRLLLLIILVLGWGHYVSAAFLPGTEDIPLMDGLTVAEDNTFNFDTPGGQILNITAIGSMKEDHIKSFYAETLPALGWVQTDQNGSIEYRRDSDVLSLTIMQRENKTTVLFSLTFPGMR